MSDATREELLAAIKEHHDQKADDRCWMDDDRLYEAAGLPAVDRHVGDQTAMLINCARFIQRRTEGGRWPTYEQLEAKIRARPDCVDAALGWIGCAAVAVGAEFYHCAAAALVISFFWLWQAVRERMRV